MKTDLPEQSAKPVWKTKKITVAGVPRTVYVTTTKTGNRLSQLRSERAAFTIDSPHSLQESRFAQSLKTAHPQRTSSGTTLGRRDRPMVCRSQFRYGKRKLLGEKDSRRLGLRQAKNKIEKKKTQKA